MSCRATPAHANETFEWRIRQRSHARPAVQRGGSGGELLYSFSNEYEILNNEVVIDV